MVSVSASQVEIISTTGVVRRTVELASNDYRVVIPIDDLPGGFYFVALRCGPHHEIVPILIAR